MSNISITAPTLDLPNPALAQSDPAGLIEALRSAGLHPDPAWDSATPIAALREHCGDVAVLVAWAHVEALANRPGPWPLDLLEVCDTLGMLADYAQVRAQ